MSSNTMELVCVLLVSHILLAFLPLFLCQLVSQWWFWMIGQSLGLLNV